MVGCVGIGEREERQGRARVEGGKKWGWTDGATGRWTGTERYIQGARIDVVLIEIS